MGRLATVLCAITGIMTIIDHFTNTPFFSQLLSRHIISTPGGYQISPGLNFFTTISLGVIVWAVLGADAPHADAAVAKKHAWKRTSLAAVSMAAWLLLGPAIRRAPPAAPQAELAPPAALAPAPAIAAPNTSPFGLKPLYRQPLGAESRTRN